MAAKTTIPLRAVRAARARITIHQVGAQYRVRVDGEWQDTYHTADGARRRADVLAAKIALLPSALPPASWGECVARASGSRGNRAAAGIGPEE